MNKETGKAVFYTAAELNQMGIDHLPGELVSNTHLIYSSPAALAFNSPGAEGFGVKRAALSIPGSVMLLVSPGCCGRNTSLVSRIPGYANRFFYLTMSETDIVTGRHLRKIPKAVEELYQALDPKPSLIMICITCVDALLGTDMERVCRKAEESIPIPVRPSYMYALTREGRKPPMVHVRQSLYSLLEPMKKKGTSVNLLGFFAPLIKNCELYELLRKIGVRKIREISTCMDYQDFLHMAEANFNLVLNAEARPAAEDFEKNLKIPSIELRRFYDLTRIRKQYQALGTAIGAPLEDEVYYSRAEDAIRSFQKQCLEHGLEELYFSIGECSNADPFELSAALLRYGFSVGEIFGTVTADNFFFIRQIAKISPNTRIYSNLEPTMIAYQSDEVPCDMTIGKDAGYYHPNRPNLSWNEDIQPFGYAGVVKLFEKLQEKLFDLKPAESSEKKKSGDQEGFHLVSEIKHSSNQAFRKYLTPFAPDQSGAVGVLYELGGIQVICDAGGCVGNICGFDEPRWFEHKSAIFSAGLRDMDAILGRDDRLVAKLADAAHIPAEFAAVIGTPVPSVIGTDYHALKRMAEKKVSMPVLAVETNGMDLYDEGEKKAYLELFSTFAEPTVENIEQERIGVLGVTPLNFSDLHVHEKMKKTLEARGWQNVDTYGMHTGLDRIRTAGKAKLNLVTSPSALAAAEFLKRKFGTPYEIKDPLAETTLLKLLKTSGLLQAPAGEEPKMPDLQGKKILISAQQVTGDSMRKNLMQAGAEKVDLAVWFMRLPELTASGDRHLSGEASFIQMIQEGQYDWIIADAELRRMVPDFGGQWIDFPQFAVSGRISNE